MATGKLKINYKAKK